MLSSRLNRSQSVRSKGGGNWHANQSSINLRSAFLFNQASQNPVNLERGMSYTRETPSVGSLANRREYSAYQTSSDGCFSSRQNGEGRLNSENLNRRGDSVADRRFRNESDYEGPLQNKPIEVISTIC